MSCSIATPSERSPCSSKASKSTEEICPTRAGKIKRDTEQSVLTGVFKVLAFENACWGAAEFYDAQLWEAFSLPCPDGGRSCGQQKCCADSVAAGTSLEGRVYVPSCLLPGMRKRKCFMCILRQN